MKLIENNPRRITFARNYGHTMLMADIVGGIVGIEAKLTFFDSAKDLRVLSRWLADRANEKEKVE